MTQERIILDPTEPTRTNYATNPSGESAAKFSAGTDFTVTREAGTMAIPARRGDYRDKHEYDGAGATVSMGFFNFLAPFAGFWVVSVFVWIPSTYNGGGVELNAVSYAGLENEVHQQADMSKRDQWQRIWCSLKIVAGDLNGGFHMEVVGAMPSNSASGIVYSDCLQIEAGSTPTNYFDGDTIPTVPTYDVAWSGTPHESTSTLTSTRTEVDITPWIDVDGVDWGDAEMEAYKAQARVGESVIDHRLPNRQITAPLVIKDQGGTTFAMARSYIQAKAALWQREGGIGQRILETGGTVYFDVVADGLTLSGDSLQANKEIDTEAELRLEAIPDFYEPEVEAASAEEKTAAELIKVIPDPGGDMPARVRIVVEEKQGQDQGGMIWAWRSRHYLSASTAKTAYEAEELQTLDAARKVALAGASGGTVVQHGTISTNWTPVVGGRIGGTAWPTHTGTNRFFARLYSTSGTLAHARLVWDVGDLVNPIENPAFRLPGASNFYIADLGEVRLDRAPIGTHRWDWQIQALGDVGNEDFKVDKVWVVNADEGMGILSAPFSAPVTGFTTYSALDSFNQTAGTLTGKTAAVGGTWAGAGALGDFSVETGGKTARRTTLEDTDLRYAVLNLNLTNTAVQADVRASISTTGLMQGVVARYSSTSSSLVAGIRWGGATGDSFVLRPSGLSESVVWVDLSPQQTYTVRLIVTAEGWAIAALFVQGAVSPIATIVRQHSSLATGGPLAVGDVGIIDWHEGEIASTRSFDNFAAWIPTPDAVVYASRSAQLTSDGMYRLDSGGTAYGPVSRVVGDLPRIPAGGLENRATELFLKVSRGDLGELPDSAIDDVAVKVFASRSWLTVPGTI